MFLLNGCLRVRFLVLRLDSYECMEEALKAYTPADCHIVRGYL